MIFSIHDYAVNALYLPLGITLLTLVWVIAFCLFWFHSCFFSKEQAEFHKYIKPIISVILCVILMIPQIITLANGGFTLLADMHKEPVVLQGTIQKIQEPSVRFPGFKSNHRYGADIKINDELFFVISCKDFHVGDCVTIVYLPNSRFILQIAGK